jgi:hypothetical protein
MFPTRRHAAAFDRVLVDLSSRKAPEEGPAGGPKEIFTGDNET